MGISLDFKHILNKTIYDILKKEEENAKYSYNLEFNDTGLVLNTSIRQFITFDELEKKLKNEEIVKNNEKSKNFKFKEESEKNKNHFNHTITEINHKKTHNDYERKENYIDTKRIKIVKNENIKNSCIDMNSKFGKAFNTLTIDQKKETKNKNFKGETENFLNNQKNKLTKQTEFKVLDNEIKTSCTSIDDNVNTKGKFFFKGKVNNSKNIDLHKDKTKNSSTIDDKGDNEKENIENTIFHIDNHKIGDISSEQNIILTETSNIKKIMNNSVKDKTDILGKNQKLLHTSNSLYKDQEIIVYRTKEEAIENQINQYKKMYKNVNTSKENLNWMTKLNNNLLEIKIFEENSVQMYCKVNKICNMQIDLINICNEKFGNYWFSSVGSGFVLFKNINKEFMLVWYEYLKYKAKQGFLVAGTNLQEGYFRLEYKNKIL